jgi:hypothetical protein
MTLKSAALFALIGMAQLTVLLVLGFIRDLSGFLAGAIAAMALLISLIHLLASLSVSIFLYVFYKSAVLIRGAQHQDVRKWPHEYALFDESTDSSMKALGRWSVRWPRLWRQRRSAAGQRRSPGRWKGNPV